MDQDYHSDAFYEYQAKKGCDAEQNYDKCAQLLVCFNKEIN